MGLLGALISAVNGSTISSSDYNSNFSDVKSSVNNITTDQVTDGTLLNADISASAEIAMSKITATASDAKLSDAQENLLDGCFLNVNSITELQVSKGSAMINGELRRNTSSTTNSPSDTADKWNDVFLVADSAASTFTLEVQTNLATPGSGTAAGTNTRLIASVYTNTAGNLSFTINYRNDEIIGWNWFNGDGTGEQTVAITFGKTLTSIKDPYIKTSKIGRLVGTEPVNVDDLVTASWGQTASDTSKIDSTTAFTVNFRTEIGGSFTSGTRHGFIWSIEGSFTT